MRQNRADDNASALGNSGGSQWHALLTSSLSLPASVDVNEDVTVLGGSDVEILTITVTDACMVDIRSGSDDGHFYLTCDYIDTASLYVSAMSLLDYETATSHILTIEAWDMVMTGSTSGSMTVNVLDVAETPTFIGDPVSFSTGRDCRQSLGRPVGTGPTPTAMMDVSRIPSPLEGRGCPSGRVRGDHSTGPVQPVDEHQMIRRASDDSPRWCGRPFAVLGDRIVLRLEMSVVLQVESRIIQFVSAGSLFKREVLQLRLPRLRLMRLRRARRRGFGLEVTLATISFTEISLIESALTRTAASGSGWQRRSVR